MPYFFDQKLRLLFKGDIYFFDQKPQLLFKGGVYFFGKTADINDSWIMFLWTIQWRLLDAVSSMRSLSVLLSAVEMSCPKTVIYIHVRVLRMLAAAVRGRHLFCSELLIVRLHSRAASIQRKPQLSSEQCNHSKTNPLAWTDKNECMHQYLHRLKWWDVKIRCQHQ